MPERKLISLTKPDDKNRLSAVNPDNYGYNETKKSEFIHNDIEYKVIDGEIYPLLKNDNSSKNIYQQMIIEAGKCRRSDMMYETINALDDDMKNYCGCLNIVKQKAIQDKMEYSDSNYWGVWFIKDILNDRIIFPYANIHIDNSDIFDLDNYINNEPPVYPYYSNTVLINNKPYMIIAERISAIEYIKKEFAPDYKDKKSVSENKYLNQLFIILIISMNIPTIMHIISIIISFFSLFL